MQNAVIIALLAILAFTLWYNRTPKADFSEESTPIADQLDVDFGVLENMSLSELAEYIKKRM
jgi:hypothetical protein